MVILLCGLFIGFIGCDSGQVGASHVRTMSPDEVFVYIQDHQDSPTLNIIDFRTPEEFRAGHIPGAVNIDYFSPQLRETLFALDAFQTYIVYCKTSNRSFRAVDVVKDKGFKDIIVMQGGLTNWVSQGYPIEAVRTQDD